MFQIRLDRQRGDDRVVEIFTSFVALSRCWIARRVCNEHKVTDRILEKKKKRCNGRGYRAAILKACLWTTIQIFPKQRIDDVESLDRYVNELN